jgi:hypothetical protein
MTTSATNAEELKRLQAPLKARYREDPEAARQRFQAVGVSRDVPVGITDIHLHFEIDSPATDEQLATLLRQTERYCVIFQTLRTPPRLATSLLRVGA